MCFAIFKLLFYSLVVRFEIASGCIVTETKNMESKPVTCIANISLCFATINLLFTVQNHVI